MTNDANQWVKRKLKELRAERGGRCAKCGGFTQLQFAHVHPTMLKGMGRGRKERYYDIINNPECYALLCSPCHKRYDAGELTL